MKRPGWGTTIGILMILFAGCTVKESLESITMPTMLDKGPEIMEEALREEGISEDSLTVLMERIDSLKSGSVQSDSLLSESEIEGMDNNNAIEKFVLSNIGDVFNMSEFTKTWMIRFGYIGLFIAVIYLIGGIVLLMVKPYSVPIAYGALVLSILYMVARIAVISPSAGDLISISMYVEGGVSIVIDIILLLVIFSSDKFAYEQAHA